MTPPSPAAGPDADALARQAVDVSQSEEVRHRAWDGLVPIIGRVAQRVALRFSGQTRQDLVGGALADVWEALQQKPRIDRFESWCYALLRNRHLDRIRHEQTEQRHAAQAGWQRPQAEDLRAALERVTDRQGLLPQADLQAVEGWSLRHRIILLSLTGLWLKIPLAQWQRWVDDHRQAHGVPADGPFPPVELQSCDDIAQRNGILSAALNLRRNTLSAWLHRGKPLLLALQYVRDLLPPSIGGTQA
jgi:hypothetical protein